MLPKDVRSVGTTELYKLPRRGQSASTKGCDEDIVGIALLFPLRLVGSTALSNGLKRDKFFSRMLSRRSSESRTEDGCTHSGFFSRETSDFRLAEARGTISSPCARSRSQARVSSLTFPCYFNCRLFTCHRGVSPLAVWLLKRASGERKTRRSFLRPLKAR